MLWSTMPKSLNLYFLIALALGVFVSVSFALSDKRLCADPNCKEIISMGLAKITYTAGEEGMVSFKINSLVRIISKSAGSNKRLWGIQVNGREGYAPKDFIMETKVLIKEKDLIEVPVELPGASVAASEAVNGSVKPLVLKASEGPAADVKVDVELTTTAPLEVEGKGQLPIVTSQRAEESKKPFQASPVQQNMEIVDGTQIPIVEEHIEVASGKFDPQDNEDVKVEDDEDDDEEKEEPSAVLNDAAEKSIEKLKQAEKILEHAEMLEAENPTVEVQEKEDFTAPSLLDVRDVEIKTSVEAKAPKETENIPDEKANAAVEEVHEQKPEELVVKKMENDVGKYETNLKDAQPVEVEVKEKENVVDKFEMNMEDEKPTSMLDASSTEVDNEKSQEIHKKPAELLNSAKNDVVVDSVVKEVAIASSLPETTTPGPTIEDITQHAGVTESGFLYPADPIGLDLYDTTTMATPIVKDAVANDDKQELKADTTPTSSKNVLENGQASPQLNTSSVVETATEVTPSTHINVVENVYTQKQEPLDSLEKTSEEMSSSEQASTEKVDLPQADVAAPSATEQVPSNVPTLPLFRQPTPMPAIAEPSTNDNQASQEEKVLPYNDPNDYYRQRAEQQQHIPQQTANLQPQQPEVIPPAVQTTEASVSQEQHYSSDVSDNSNEVETVETTTTTTTTTIGIGSVEHMTRIPQIPADPQPLPLKTPPELDEPKAEHGLFATILGTVNSFLSNDKKDSAATKEDANDDDELERILFPERALKKKTIESDSVEYCEKVLPHDCPAALTASGKQKRDVSSAVPSSNDCHFDLNDMSLERLAAVFSAKLLEMSELIACLTVAAAASIFFIFGYYCFCNSSREGALLSKLNMLERCLLAMQKENKILKDSLENTRYKLSSIEDNSFGSNDMVMSLKQELDEVLLEKDNLHQQVCNLEKELENATEAGLELNKIVSDLLNNQSGDESIISSVEELQRQLNEQQNTILEINSNLAEKSRENSELQLMLAEQNARSGGEIASLQQDNDELEAEKANLQTRLEEIKREFEEDLTKALEGKNFEIQRLQTEMTELQSRCEDMHTKWQTSEAKIEALEECLRTVKKDPSVNINKVIDAAKIRAELLDLQKKRTTLSERLAAESDARRLAEDQLQAAVAEFEKIKLDFHQSEKDKLEAQTRLEVLSNYFKEKETQLQKDLSLKETMWLKQQGETTSTVDRLTAMQTEIQSLKSQNDALRAEIEAQLAAHKAQTGTLENRAHETWLAARQSERRYEEARAEATALRRKLTALAAGNSNEPNQPKLNSNELNNAPSPIHMESPGSPLMGRMPPPFLPPPPFMGPPPPFMGMPPPFVPPGEMRPPPLGRIMSPPPPLRGSRYSPDHHYNDYDDEYDDDDDEEVDELSHRRGRRRSITNGSWHRDDSYSPPRTYRSHSPADNRYYNTERDLISTYDTETDFSPPPSPRDRRARGSRAGSFKAYSPQPTASSPIGNNTNNGGGSKKHAATAPGASKGISSGSERSYNSSSHHGKRQQHKKSMV